MIKTSTSRGSVFDNDIALVVYVCPQILNPSDDLLAPTSSSLADYIWPAICVSLYLGMFSI
jgi:hypothetical protein